MRCRNLGNIHARMKNGLEIYHCDKLTACSLVPSELKLTDGSPLPMCSEECSQYNGPKVGDIFDRVVIINLARRPDRLEQIRVELAKHDWPFVAPVVMNAIDGKKIECPAGYTEGNHVWACFQSHRRAIEDAINDDCHSVLVLEDDAILCDDFAERSKQFMRDIPDDWEFAWLGVHHMQTPIPVKPGVVKTVQVDCCHAYAARGQGLIDLYKYWHQWHTGTTAHCDWSIAHWMRDRKSYAAEPQLIGQRGGYSDLTWGQKPENWWLNNPQPTITPMKTPTVAEIDLRLRVEFNLEEFPCRWRGQLKGVKDAADGFVKAPCYECDSPRTFNQTKEATLWQVEPGETIPYCNRCPFRELPTADQSQRVYDISGLEGMFK